MHSTTSLGLSMALITLLATACDRDRQPEPKFQPDPNAVSADPVGPAGSGDDEEHEEHGHEGPVHLGTEMFHISRRFSAVWFAGRAGNAQMVDYQLHELEEHAERIEGAKIREGGLEVGPEFEKRIVSHFEALETHAEKGDAKAFEAEYKKTMAACAQCHAETAHPYIVPKIPTRNPYPNIEVGGGD